MCTENLPFRRSWLKGFNWKLAPRLIIMREVLLDAGRPAPPPPPAILYFPYMLKLGFQMRRGCERMPQLNPRDPVGAADCAQHDGGFTCACNPGFEGPLCATRG